MLFFLQALANMLGLQFKLGDLHFELGAAFALIVELALQLANIVLQFAISAIGLGPVLAPLVLLCCQSIADLV